MAEKVIHEMISAYASGCMDKENFVNFKDYIDDDFELPYRELGEMQNLMALIPLILELETPDPRLKEILASRIMSIQNEIKAKNKKEKAEENNEKGDKLLPTEKFYKTRVTKKIIDKNYEKGKKNKQEVYKRNLNSEAMPGSHKIVEQPLKHKKKFSRFALWMGLAAVVLILLGTALYFYDLNTSLSENVSVLKDEITLLENELSSNREFIDNYNLLIEFFNYKDIFVIDLSPAERGSEAFGKLFIAYGELKGILELNKMPSLSLSETYQLWIVSRGVSYSLGVFRPDLDDQYFQIPQIPYFSIGDLELVRLTLEPAEGSSSPRGQTKLFGVISGNNLRRRR